jgi:hypothetical protein
MDPITAKYAPLFEVTLQEGEVVSLAGLGQHVQTGERHGRGAGEGIYGLTNSKFVFRFDDPPPEGGRFVAFPLDVIVDAEQKWIVVPGMSELVLQVNGPNGVFVSSYYIGTRMSSQLGRVILGDSGSTEDQMSAAPDQSGSYGPIDGLLEEIAAEAGSEVSIKGDRRPGRRSSTD